MGALTASQSICENKRKTMRYITSNIQYSLKPYAKWSYIISALLATSVVFLSMTAFKNSDYGLKKWGLLNSYWNPLPFGEIYQFEDPSFDSSTWKQWTSRIPLGVFSYLNLIGFGSLQKHRFLSWFDSLVHIPLYSTWMCLFAIRLLSVNERFAVRNRDFFARHFLCRAAIGLVVAKATLHLLENCNIIYVITAFPHHHYENLAMQPILTSLKWLAFALYFGVLGAGVLKYNNISYKIPQLEQFKEMLSSGG